MFRCQPCGVCLNSQGQLSQHRAGKSHARKMKQLGLTDTIPKDEIPAEAFVPKYGGTFVSAQHSEVGEEEKQVIKEVLTTATTPEDFNSMLSEQFKVPIPNPGTKQSEKEPGGGAGSGAGKRKFSEIYCEVCHVTINSDLQAQQHFQGSKHNKKMKLIADVSDGEATSTTDAAGRKKITSHFCHFCNISVNSQEQMQVHRTGSKHRKNVEKLQLSAGTTNSSQNNTQPSFDITVSSS